MSESAEVKAYPPQQKSLAQQILDANDVEVKPCAVPEWGVEFELRSPTGEERAALVATFIDVEETQRTGSAKMRDLKRMYPSLIIACSYSPDTGERIFPNMDETTLAALNRKNGAVLERVALECLPLVGLTPDAVEEKKEGSSTAPTNGNLTP